QDRQDNGEEQKQLSKEFVREWLMENGFMGKEGQQVPEMTDEFVDLVSKRYIELFEIVSGTTFTPDTSEDPESRVHKNIVNYMAL
ncbi:MAG: phosphoribosylaminoimidazole-succinocarboxamide synthase, partial [Gammaproteobacteria bacterium]